MTERYVFLSDIQYPYHDKRAVSNLVCFLAGYKPDRLYSVGDELDSPEPSRWNKGMAGEYAGTLQKSIDGLHSLLADLRAAVGDIPFELMRSNHCDRVETYVRKYAPALGCLDSLKFDAMLGLDDLNIKYNRSMIEVAPGWVLAHGDEGGLSRIPGSTAMSLARSTGKSVVCGHTHRAGIQHETRAFGGKATTIFGMEVGNLMDMRQAHYLKTGTANWQQGFGILYVDGRKVTPVLVPIHADGSFTVEGVRYSP